MPSIIILATFTFITMQVIQKRSHISLLVLPGDVITTHLQIPRSIFPAAAKEFHGYKGHIKHSSNNQKTTVLLVVGNPSQRNMRHVEF